MNIINAICTLCKLSSFTIASISGGNNRANNAGDALELFVKDLFADTVEVSENIRLERMANVFSYLGNNSNPPDAMLKNGDAIEIKKIESDNSALALNSSYPKHTLKATSSMISNECRNVEKWSEKDIIYAVGVIRNNRLTSLCFVYGLDYCASEECYERIKSTIKTGVEKIQGIEFAETKELGHINKVDPLGITYMRVRGMWGIENPWKVFKYIYSRKDDCDFNFMCIINDEKLTKLENYNDLLDLNKKINSFSIDDVKIKNPDNPAKLVSAKLISYWR
ncbi:MAG: NgoPII family restriction endonuclease [Lachnospiraceae bacterium]|nr:NgoPII family restriction endonuclease [Lachnospiraceae bacterium]